MTVLITRYDAHHAARIEISHQQDDFMAGPLQEIENFGFQICTICDALAFALDLKKVEQKEIDKALLKAIAAGDRYFFIEYGKHSSEWVRFSAEKPPRDWDSGCAGLLVWPREKWRACFSNRPYVSGCAMAVLTEFSAYLTAAFNGWLYQYDVYNADGSHELLGTGFLTEDEALKAAQAEYPEIKYKEDEFTTIASYCRFVLPAHRLIHQQA